MIRKFSRLETFHAGWPWCQRRDLGRSETLFWTWSGCLQLPVLRTESSLVYRVVGKDFMVL